MNDLGGSSLGAAVGSSIFAKFVDGFFAPIAEALQDPEVSEVLINGPSEVFVEKGGRLQASELRFSGEGQLLSALRSVAQFLGRPFDEQHPILEGRLPDGSRLQAVLPPLAAGGPCVAIRCHRQEKLTIEKLLKLGTLSEEQHALLLRLVEGRKNMLISGGTGSGKTSLLRCVASLIESEERIVTIEDARELALQNRHVVSLESRPASEGGIAAITIGDLFAATLRLRPDRIVIGELRGGEALDLIQAMTSGHGGCLSTVHASSPVDALRRLETMALYRGIDLPLAALRSQVSSAVDIIVQIERCPSGRRLVRSIAEVGSLDERGDYQVDVLTERAPDSSLEARGQKA